MRRSVRRGFSIVETIAILVIIAILLLIAIPQFTRPTLAAVAAPDSVVSPGSFGALAVKVSNAHGVPQRGVVVRFEVDGKGSVTPSEIATDSMGVARVMWQAWPDTGALSVTARAGGRSRPALVFRTRVRDQPSPAPASTSVAAPHPQL